MPNSPDIPEYVNPIPPDDPEDREYASFLLGQNHTEAEIKTLLALRQRAFGA